MPTYYVGPGGNDANDGLSWVNRKLTLNGCEDVPITAGSTVYVGPGVYRELLTCDVSGTAGNPITYVGDVTGAATDGVGGVVRITGSDNDTTTARNYCITVASKTYRTFRGFTCSFGTAFSRIDSLGTGGIVEDCAFESGTGPGVFLAPAGTGQIVRRCVFLNAWGYAVSSSNGTPLDDRGWLIEDCLSIGGRYAMYFYRIGGITIRNCTIIGGEVGVYSEYSMIAI